MESNDYARRCHAVALSIESNRRFIRRLCFSITKTHRDVAAFVALLRFSPQSGVSIDINFDVDHAGATADGAVLDVLLARSLRQVDGDDDFLATGVTDVARFILHGGSSK